MPPPLLAPQFPRPCIFIMGVTIKSITICSLQTQEVLVILCVRSYCTEFPHLIIVIIFRNRNYLWNSKNDQIHCIWTPLFVETICFPFQLVEIVFLRKKFPKLIIRSVNRCFEWNNLVHNSDFSVLQLPNFEKDMIWTFSCGHTVH